MRLYDFYTDLYATHAEIGYLLGLAVVLAGFDGGVGVLIARYPAADTYLVPGVVAYADIPVSWSRRPPAPTPQPPRPLPPQPSLPLADGSRSSAPIEVLPPAVLAEDGSLAPGMGAGADGVIGNGAGVGAGSASAAP